MPSLFICLTEEASPAIRMFHSGRQIDLYEWWARQWVGDDRLAGIRDPDDIHRWSTSCDRHATARPVGPTPEGAMNKIPIHLDVNGIPYDLLVDPGRSLVDVLRDDLQLTGTKRFLQRGRVRVLRRAPRRDRRQLVPRARGAGGRREDLTTIEGLASNGTLDAVQQAFADRFAAQCGYCTPGMIMTAKALLADNPKPTEDEIRQAIRGNLCRCTGYTKIVEAIQAASGQLRRSPVRDCGRGAQRRRTVAAARRPREKVTGKAPYAYDMHLPGMLWGEILRSPYAHAKIGAIDTFEAEQIPGVIAVYTQKDMPQTKFGAFVQDETALANGVVRYQGEGVAAVIAVDEETALRGIEAIEVAYEPIEGVYKPRGGDGEGPRRSTRGPSATSRRTTVSRPATSTPASRRADHVFEDRFITSRQCHVCMEPHALVADYDPSGRVTLHISSQSTFFDRFGLEGIFGLPANKIRIISPYLGGGFGSKSEPHSIYVVAIQASMNLGRPVKMSIRATRSSRRAAPATRRSSTSRPGSRTTARSRPARRA